MNKLSRNLTFLLLTIGLSATSSELLSQSLDSQIDAIFAEFDRDDNNSISGLIVNAGRVQNLSFVKSK